MYAPIENEEQVCRDLWRKWESKILTTVRQRAIEGVIGCTFEDLQSLARQVMIYTIRSYNPTEAKFSTYLYANLLNAIKTEYAKAGLVRQWYGIRVTRRKCNTTRDLQIQFATQEEAQAVADMLGGTYKAVIVPFQTKRQKRIPPHLVSSLLAPVNRVADVEEAEEGTLENYVASKKDTVLEPRRVLEVVSRVVEDKLDRKILLLLYQGYPPRAVCKAVALDSQGWQKKLRQLRRTTVKVIRELVY